MTLSMRDKAFWRRLTKAERRELVAIQTAPRSGNMGGGGYLPDDCSECTYCGEPKMGYPGLCTHCYGRWEALMTKGRGMSRA